MDLGCVEFAVPGKTLAEKLEVLERRGMWLELANDGKKQARDVKQILVSYSVPVHSLQAYRQHEFQLLSAGLKERELARRHIEETIHMAAELGARNVVTVIGYGAPGIGRPREACVELLTHFGMLGQGVGVDISVEPLGAKTSFLPRASDVYELVKEVAADNVKMLIDTMHVYSTGDDPAQVIEKYAKCLGEVQLRDTSSKPPGKGEMDFGRIIGSIRENFGGLVCLEYKPGRNPRADFELACETWKSNYTCLRCPNR